MKNLTDYLDKPLISLISAEHLGMVDTVYFDSDMRRALYLRANNLNYPFDKLKSGKNAVLTPYGETCPDLKGLLPAPIGLPVYTSEGESLGTVDEVKLSTSRVISVTVSGVDYPASRIGKLSRTLLIMLLDGKRRLPRPKKEIPPVEEPFGAPKTVVSDYGFLLGRRLHYDVYDQRREIIARAGATVTREIVERARRSGKLVELTISTRR